ncbi:MAG TPA: hypothetical protein VFT46_06960 [Holophagaceae bacterium]|nr:hypothetical protein [Holophagaceae bacterium]
MAPASLLRSRTAAAAAAFGLALLTACGGSGKSSSTSDAQAPATVHGKVTYVRPALLRDSNGLPTGLDPDPAHASTLPARRVVVRIYQHQTVGTAPNTAQQWVRVAEVPTGSDGTFSTIVQPGDNYLVELVSSLTASSGPAVRLISDPQGLASTDPWYKRPQYFLRASLSGQAATPSELAPVASATSNGNYTVNFAVDNSTSWLQGSTEVNPAGGIAADFDTCAFEASPSGAKILSILDAITDISSTYPNGALKAPVDLHYAAGVSDPGGSYIEYHKDRWVQAGGFDPAYDANGLQQHYFATLQAGSGADDGWNLSAIYTMFSRYALFSQGSGYPFGQNADARLLPLNAPADGLSPDIALTEGLPGTMAANLLKSPYLYSLDGSGAVTATRDVRDLSAVAPAAEGPFSSRTLGALGWEVVLKANSLPSPGVAADWSTVNPVAAARFFELPSATAGVYAPPSIYTQLTRLQEAKASAEPVDLAAIFTDSAINTLASPFNVPWSTASAAPSYGSTWTVASGTSTFSDTLSMADDVLVGGVYANESNREVRYLGLDQSADQTYQLSLAMSPSSLTGGSLQVQILTNTGPKTYAFTGSTAQPITLALSGSGDTANPTRYPVLVRLLSPSTVQPDVTFTMTLTAVAPSLKNHGSPALR